MFGSGWPSGSKDGGVRETERGGKGGGRVKWREEVERGESARKGRVKGTGREGRCGKEGRGGRWPMGNEVGGVGKEIEHGRREEIGGARKGRGHIGLVLNESTRPCLNSVTKSTRDSWDSLNFEKRIPKLILFEIKRVRGVPHPVCD